MQSDPFSTLEIFFGASSFAEARIYARVSKGPDAPAEARLAGRIVGPFRAGGQTLSASVPLRPALNQATDGPALLAEATLPDPCFWSPDLPFLYTVTVELLQGARRLATAERLLGVRPLGVRDGHLWLEGRPWTPRGVRTDEAPPVDLALWRGAGAALIADDPSDALCEQASRQGVAIVAWLNGPDQIVDRVARLARWPAPTVAVIGAVADDGASLRTAARNLLLAQAVDLQAPILRADWADLVVCRFAPDAGLSQVSAPNHPALAYRPAVAGQTLAEARRACDRLQAALAGRGEWAGYLV